jgi:hypothetical protein
MTGIVLALAGLSCGDGGPKVDAAIGPVERPLVGEWVGEFRIVPPGALGLKPVPVEWDLGGGRMRAAGIGRLPPGRWAADSRLVAVGNGHIRVTISGKSELHTCRWHGSEVHIDLPSTKPEVRIELVLRPAPRKP